MKTTAASPLDLVRTHCCVCEDDDAVPVGVGSDFEYQTSTDLFVAMRCLRCGLIYLDPRPASSEIHRIYPPSYHAFDFSEESFGLIHKIRSRLESRRLLKWCRGLPDNAKILDVGCGDGFHLDLLRRFGKPGWRLEGIDTSQKAVTAAQKKGLKVGRGDVADLQLDGAGFDLVLLVMTIEHVEDPGRLLEAVRRLLEPGGRLIVVTDNTRSLDARVFRGAYWGGYHFPRHWNLFDRQSLTRLAVKSGLTVSSLNTAVSPVNWVYSIHNLLTDLKAPQWLINRFTLKSPVSLSFFTGLDGLLSIFGHGSILHAILSKPGSLSHSRIRLRSKLRQPAL